jgi:hypothetical protein
MLKSKLITIYIVLFISSFAISCEAKTGQVKAEAADNQGAEISQQVSKDSARSLQKKDDDNEKTGTVRLPPHLSHIVYGGGDGRSCENAIKIQNARNTAEGIEAEKVWIAANFPGSQRSEHAIAKQDGKMVEAFKLKTGDGNIINICFDVTSFFGNW